MKNIAQVFDYDVIDEHPFIVMEYVRGPSLSKCLAVLHKKINNTGSGYGFLLNSNNAGYIQAVFARADYAANSQGASQNMIAYGAEVKACAENLAQWIPQLKDTAQTILAATSLTDLQGPVNSSSDLIAQIQNGIDLDGNGIIDPSAGECGAQGLYTSAYAMADMPLLPINLLGTPTATTGTPSPVGTIVYTTNTPAKGSGGGGNAANTPVPTKR